MTVLQPVGLDFFERAPHRFEFVEPVPAPPAVVFAAISADPATWTWFPGLDEGRYESAPPHGVGAIRYVRMGEWLYRETLLAFDPPTRWAYRVDETTSPLFSALAEDWRVEADGDTARVRWTFAFDAPDCPPGMSEIVGGVFGAAMAALGRALAGSSDGTLARD
jgi:hypothetical protein